MHVFMCSCGVGEVDALEGGVEARVEGGVGGAVERVVVESVVVERG